MNVSVCSVLLSLSGTFLIFCGVAEGESSSLISRFVLVFFPATAESNSSLRSKAV